MDGANINSLGAIGASMQVSQEIVQEFQLSTANFDLSTGLTSNGSINIVTRSGGTDFHGSAFYFYRDHNLAADPGCDATLAIRIHCSNGLSSGIRTAGLFEKIEPLFSPVTNELNRRASSRFSRARLNSPRSAESSPVPIRAISSMLVLTCG